LTISEVTRTTKRQRGALQKLMNCKKFSTHLYTKCTTRQENRRDKDIDGGNTGLQFVQLLRCSISIQ